MRSADESKIGTIEGEKENDQSGLYDEICEVDNVLEVKTVVGKELDCKIPAPGSDQEGCRDSKEEEDRTGFLSGWDVEDCRGEVCDHKDDRDHQEDNCGEAEESSIERLIRCFVISSLEVDGEESRYRRVQGLDNDCHIPCDRCRERNDTVGCDPEGVDEVWDQEDADGDVYQEVGDVCSEVTRKLGSQLLIYLPRTECRF